MNKNSRFYGGLLWLIVTLVVFMVLLKLSFWQYQRGIDKQQRSERITQLTQAEPFSLNKVVELSTMTQFTNKESINDFPVALTGNFNRQFLFFLDNQVEKRILGYRVLQVMETPDHAVLVNLGWVPGSVDRKILPQVSALTGQHAFNGHVRLIEQGIMLTEQDFSKVSWPLRIQQVEIDKLSTLINKTLLPFVVYVNQEDSLGFEKNWHPIVMPAEKHFAYSFQWAALAITWLILMFLLKMKVTNTKVNAVQQRTKPEKTASPLHNG